MGTSVGQMFSVLYGTQKSYVNVGTIKAASLYTYVFQSFKLSVKKIINASVLFVILSVCINDQDSFPAAEMVAY